MTRRRNTAHIIVCIGKIHRSVDEHKNRNRQTSLMQMTFRTDDDFQRMSLEVQCDCAWTARTHSHTHKFVVHSTCMQYDRCCVWHSLYANDSTTIIANKIAYRTEPNSWKGKNSIVNANLQIKYIESKANRHCEVRIFCILSALVIFGVRKKHSMI